MPRMNAEYPASVDHSGAPGLPGKCHAVQSASDSHRFLRGYFRRTKRISGPPPRFRLVRFVQLVVDRHGIYFTFIRSGGVFEIKTLFFAGRSYESGKKRAYPGKSNTKVTLTFPVDLR